jgi:hypothetical protein
MIGTKRGRARERIYLVFRNGTFTNKSFLLLLFLLLLLLLLLNAFPSHEKKKRIKPRQTVSSIYNFSESLSLSLSLSLSGPTTFATP